MPDDEVASAVLSSLRGSPAAFRAALAAVPRTERDAWVDRVFRLGEPPDDGPDLPRGCVPYLPCSADTLLRMVELAEVNAEDVFVDVGSGMGRATALTHFLTGADAIGIEVQSALVRESRQLAARLNAPRVSVLEGDAVEVIRSLAVGSVFFLYCPFSGGRLSQVLDSLEAIARTRVTRICTVDLPLPPCPWLTPVSVSRDLTVYRSVR